MEKQEKTRTKKEILEEALDENFFEYDKEFDEWFSTRNDHLSTKVSDTQLTLIVSDSFYIDILDDEDGESELYEFIERFR